ncbi:hypothetical protein [Nocardioides sp. CFH 31398]|uniref:hypothetical protein n=1 Tax=Nocardioides sp. CFH 31398 TaxID=2919579 RepID=UPI001F06D501|nr:hypothetical protein [Nocardioides sp. CFH 31398]MCH1868217.1 hypothetical protein [Nocardioides sp. CFH 31398]
MTGSVVRGPVRRLRAALERAPRRVVVLGAAAAVLVLLVAGAALWWVQRPYASDLDGVAGRSSVVSPGLAARTLARLRQAVVSGDRAAARDLAPADDPRAADLLEAVVDNARALDVVDLGLRYVDEVPAADGTPGAQWPAAVELTWRFAGFDTGASRVETVVAFAREGERVSVVGFGALPTTDQPFGSPGTGVAAGTRTPIWLTGPVEVRRGGQVLVLAADEVARGLDGYEDLAAFAVPAVARDAPGWDERLVVEVPRDVASLAAAIGAEEDSVAAAAAVTATSDGTDGGDAGGVHVYVNAAVFDTLGPRGAELVMNHEAVHVATRAPGSPAPTWLVEGYADYVALRDADVPERRAAAQVAQRVRDDGVPTSLPTPADFDLTGTHAGATYEAAWLACVVLADEAGPAALRRVYTAADRGVPLTTALARSTDLDVAGLTRLWQDRLREVSRRAAGEDAA